MNYDAEKLTEARKDYYYLIDLISIGTKTKSRAHYILAFKLFMGQDLVMIDPANIMAYNQLCKHLSPVLERVFTSKLEGYLVDVQGNPLTEEQKKMCIKQVTKPLINNGNHVLITATDTLESRV